jgi:lysozyme
MSEYGGLKIEASFAKEDHEMRMSERGKKLLVEWEGFKNTVYLDAAQLPTIGVGHLLTKAEQTSGKILIGGQPVRYANGLTNDQVMALLTQDLEKVEKVLNSSAKVALSQNQFDALVSFAFNVGERAFKTSTLLWLLNEGKYNEVPGQLRRWVYAAGRKSDGLVNRRGNEIKLWLEGVTE